MFALIAYIAAFVVVMAGLNWEDLTRPLLKDLLHAAADVL